MIYAKIATDPKLARKLKALAKRANGLVWAKAQTFAAEARAVLVDAAVVAPWELDAIDFERIREILSDYPRRLNPSGNFDQGGE